MVLVCGLGLFFFFSLEVPTSQSRFVKSIVILKSLSGLKAFEYGTEAYKESTSTV